MIAKINKYWFTSLYVSKDFVIYIKLISIQFNSILQARDIIWCLKLIKVMCNRKYKKIHIL